MRTNYLLTGLAMASILFASCEADDTAEIVINSTITNNDNSTTNNGGGTNTPTGENINLVGEYNEDLTLDPINNYTLIGSMIMKAGTTLTIPAGTRINAFADGANVYIAIAQGARIVAQGTAANPIVMTSNASAPAAGDWGGLILLGRAPVNSSGTGATSTSEIGALPYGGAAEDDNSGTLRYVRVEYSGGAADGQSENNGFSFYGVGNGTVVEYIQAFEGADDGVEFFGGTVNANNVSVINCQDDSIDYTEGWSGTITDVYVKHGAAHDHGIEGDGYSPEAGNNSNPQYFANPTFVNFSINGTGETDGVRAILLREGTQGTLTNFVVDGFQIGVQIRGDAGNSPTAQQILDDELNINNIKFLNVGQKLDKSRNTGPDFTEAQLITEGDATGTDYATWGAGWTKS